MSSPKNVLFIMTDQQHFRTLGCNGVACARTPNLDALAAGGINFTQHVVTNPVCGPSRASIMTGKYITEHGGWANGTTLPTTNVTLPQVFGQAGWQTAHFGKLHLVPIINRTSPHPPYGFDVCEVSEGDQQLIDDEHFRWLRRTHPDLFVKYLTEMFVQGHTSGYKSELPEECHLSTYVTDRGVDWLRNRRQKNQPFFLKVSYFDPHHAWNPCEPYYSMFEKADVPEPVFQEGAIDSKPASYRGFFNGCKGMTRNPERITPIIRAYHAMMAHLDVCVGRLMQTLREEGLDKDTVVVFTTDHGEFLGNHGLLWKGPYMLDDLVRVPLIISMPGQPRPGRTCDDVTSGVDLMATMLSAAGAHQGPVESGIPIVDNDLNLFPCGKREYALVEWEANKPAKETNSLRCIRTRDYKLVRYGGHPNVGELYDLRNDPNEFANRWDDPQYAAVKAELMEKLADHYLTRRPGVPYEGGW